MSAGAPSTSRVGSGHHEAFLGASHPYIQKPSCFLDLALDQISARRHRNELLILYTDDVDARKLEALGGVQREKIDPIARRIDAVMPREHSALEERADLRRQRSAGAGLHQSTQTRHRLRVTLVGRALAADAFHHVMPAEERDQLVDGRDCDITASVSFRAIRIEAITVA